MADPALGRLPKDARFELSDIDLGLIEPESMDQAEYRLAGADWDEGDSRIYRDLEAAIRAGENVPPLALRKRPDGTYSMLDGYHRASIARQLGMKTFPAYVHVPQP
jgi:ParB-like chromosome segregation protein Spo0J